MSPGATYALLTFSAGLLLLLAWLYANVENTRSGAILKKSLLLFALPIMVAPGEWVQVHIGMWFWVACEEGLKAFASTREQNPVDRFWLVLLFGIWELTLDKPFRAFVLAQPLASWNGLELSGLVYATALPVLMHTVTAAIYAFALERRIWAAFIASWIVHATFNSAVGYFGVSVLPVIGETVVLTLVLAGIRITTPRQPIPENAD
jgi:hypothetical protein